MRVSFLKCTLIAIALSGLSLFAYAEAAMPPGPDTFESVCVNAWMKNSDKAKDKVDYKNFGEKYCGCAAAQNIDTNDKEALKKAIQVCMSRTLLHDAMDSLEDEVGLSEAKDTDVSEYCVDRFKLIFEDNSENAKVSTAYCECAKPKLMDLIKQSDDQTDKQYSEAIDTIAADCSASIQP